jgi:O-antigen/teichoic acid export membrane protein
LAKVSEFAVPLSVRRLSFNLVTQIGGQIVPVLAAAVAVPVVYHHIGAAQFGLFTLALSALGLLSILDLGLGRATVRYVAQALAANDRDRANSVIMQSMAILGLFSLVLTLFVVLLLPAKAPQWMHVIGQNASDVRSVVYILGCSIPVIGITSVFRALLESHERFPLIGVIQSIFGGLTYGLPLIAALFVADVRVIVAAAVACRMATSIVFAIAAGKYWREALSRGFRGWFVLSDFAKFSGWTLVSNLVGNAVVYADRAIVATLFPLSVLAFYNVPLELLIRLMIVVNGAITVVFPRLSRLSLDEAQLEKIHVLIVMAMGATLAIPLLCVSILTPILLNLWLGVQFRAQSTELVRILLIGLFFLSINAFGLASLYARGVSRVVALMHCLEAPVYLAALWYAGRLHGLNGIALVWSARMAVEFVCFTWMHAVFSKNVREQIVGFALIVLQCVPMMILAKYADISTGVAIAVGVFGFAVGITVARRGWTLHRQLGVVQG